LIELLVTIAIAAILAGLAAPSFRQLMAGNRLKSHASAFHTGLLLARSEAIKRKSRVVVCKSAGTSCTTDGGWQQGWIVFADADNDATIDAGEEVIQKVGPLSGDFLLMKHPDTGASFANYVSYSSTGAVKLTGSDTSQTGEFILCQSGISGGDARQIGFSITGRLSVGKAPAETCTPP
jgi:type IV fimbrial biogenesis protein FimT